MKSIYILGIRVHDVTMDEAVARVGEFVRSGGAHMIVTPNPEMCLAGERDAEFRDILNRADLAIPDGFGLLLAARFLGTPLRERVTGVDLLERIAEESMRRGWRVYLLGGDPGIAARAARTLQGHFPSVLIVGADDGGKGTAERIRAANPDILFVAFGQVKQEKWIAENISNLPSVKVAMGVGGAFDFLAGKARRAPKMVRAAGLEWLWRLCVEPWRARRIWNAVVRFPMAVLRKKSASRSADHTSAKHPKR